MSDAPNCPKCESKYAYQEVMMFICPICQHEWSGNDFDIESSDSSHIVKDSHGSILLNGDTVIIIKDLKVKGSSQSIKMGTKVKNITLIEGDHDIDCKIKGFGSMQLKSQFVRKA